MQRTFAEELKDEGREEGRQKGREEEAVQSRQQTLLRQLRRRFGDVPETIASVVNACRSVEQLDSWLDNLVMASSLHGVGIRGSRSAKGNEPDRGDT